MFRPLHGDADDDRARGATARAREAEESAIEDVPDEEHVDEADAESRLDQDPDEQKNRTDPAYDPDEDAAG